MPTLELAKTQSFMRDKFVPFSEANVSIASSPVLYGLSVYSVFSARWDNTAKKLYIFRLRDHYQRLVNSAKIVDFHSFVQDWPFERFKETMLQLLMRNNPQQDVLVRVSVFIDELSAGTKIHGLKNSLSAYVYPKGQLLPKMGAHLCVSSWQRTADNSIPSRAKLNGSYINASLMKNEAILNGYDDAIAVDGNGHVTESSVANIFMYKNGQLITPSSSSDLLEGITRDTIKYIASSLGLDLTERPVDRSELYLADEVFLCGTSADITPVLSIDKREVGSGTIGPLTKKLGRLYSLLQHGQLQSPQDWLMDVSLNG